MTRPGPAAWQGKWKAHDAARRDVEPDPATRRQRRLPAGKAWMLRIAWFISTGTLLLGAILIVLILSGHGPRPGG